ncbi:MAG: hypothetical protein GY762_15155 [Proteobacteria bacterium]|nr:hypothetical protein [Pseudomonadota bacterium]
MANLGQSSEKKGIRKQETEDPRQKLLREEYDAYEDKVIGHSAAGLTADEKKMLKYLLAAAEQIEDLYMLQIHPNNLAWKHQIMKSGTEIEKKMFLRYQMPWCGDNTSPLCSVLEEAPEKEVGHVLWPSDFTDEEYDGLSMEINGRELLSPFTVVRRKEKRGYEAIPYAMFDIYEDKLKKIIGYLRQAAQVAPNKSLARFLLSRADAFESDSAFPYDDSDYDWIALQGDWEVTIGPYETYKSPRQLKAMFQMFIGREDREITGELLRFKENLQAMEDALATLVGEEIYQSRKLDPRISIRAVDIWMAAGDGRKDRGATVAFHLPNRGKAVDEGLYKKVMMVNHSFAFEDVSRARAELVLDRDQLKYLDVRSDIVNVAFHEFSHGFGAYHEMKIQNAAGKTMTVKQALKKYDSLLEELKADTIGLWLIQFQKGMGLLTGEQAKKRYISAIVHSLGLLQYPLTDLYSRMSAVQIGWYIDNGAVVWDAENGRFGVNFEKMPTAVEALAKKVATIQLTGDYEQAKDLVSAYLIQRDDGEYEVKGTLGDARTVIMDKFKEAGIKSPSLRYNVTGLSGKNGINGKAGL